MLTLLENADVFAPEALGRRHLLVGGGRILWIGGSPPEVVEASFPVERFDLDGLRLVPGLIDGHVHLTGGGGEGGFKTRVPPVALSAFTRGGTTSVVGMLGTDDATRDIASLVGAARGLVQEGLSAWCLTGGYHIPPATLTGGVRTDVVHIDRILGVGEIAISDSATRAWSATPMRSASRSIAHSAKRVVPATQMALATSARQASC